MTNNIDIETALSQLTGSARPFSRLRMMVGAYNLIDHTTAVSFRFKGSRAASYCKIELAADDTYTVTFANIRNYSLANEQRYGGVYASALRELFESVTNMYLSL